MLDWDGCRNARDLGGYPAGLGRRTRRGALVRSDTLGRLTPAGQAAVVAYGVRTVVDVRFADEAAREPHPFREHPVVAYVNAPINDGMDPADVPRVSAAFAAAVGRVEANQLELDVNPVGIARIATAVARARPGGVVVHCQAGHGRTGIVAAVLLSLVGVPDDLIAADFALSGPSSAHGLAEWQAHHPEATADQIERARAASIVAPEAMLATLDYLRDHHGGAERYLLRGGASRENLARLIERLTEPDA